MSKYGPHAFDRVSGEGFEGTFVFLCFSQFMHVGLETGMILFSRKTGGQGTILSVLCSLSCTIFHP